MHLAYLTLARATALLAISSIHVKQTNVVSAERFKTFIVKLMKDRKMGIKPKKLFKTGATDKELFEAGVIPLRLSDHLKI
ncbi:hypothetical protein PC123_g17667 [Phytophthora cactorum]|nr:hypothetical protein PC123_g17667 [Phytophthora cactorum]